MQPSLPKIFLQLAAVFVLLTACGLPVAQSTATASSTLAPTASPIDTPPPTTAPAPIKIFISPNLNDAHRQGFQLLAGHPPFTIDFSATVSGGRGILTYAWDFDGDSVSDAIALDPDPYTFIKSGEYNVQLTVTEESGQVMSDQRRIVVIDEPKWPQWKYGVCDHLDQPELYQSDQEMEQASQMIQDAGIQVLRVDMDWSLVQPSKGTYDWRRHDQIVTLAQKHGFEIMPILDYSSEWASTATNPKDGQDRLFAPPILAEYAWYAYKAADRYKSDIHAWEIWNEPNLSFFWRPEPNPALYTALLQNAYLAIKYADPSAVVVFGGMAPNGYSPAKFLQGVYEAGGRSFFDVVAYHPYTDPNEGTSALKGRLERIRAVMIANGDINKPIWITEYGIPSGPSQGVSNAGQARWLSQSLYAVFSLDYVPVFF